MSKKLIIVFIVSHLVVISVGVYAGMKYQENKTPAELAGTNFQNLQNLSPEERQARLQQFGADMNGARGTRTNGGSVSGEIIGKDDKSVTIKLRDGGSQIIFFSDSTEIMKSAAGSFNDLKAGETITARGNQNSDGSFTSQTIQLSPILFIK